MKLLWLPVYFCPNKSTGQIVKWFYRKSTLFIPLHSSMNTKWHVIFKPITFSKCSYLKFISRKSIFKFGRWSAPLCTYLISTSSSNGFPYTSLSQAINETKLTRLIRCSVKIMCIILVQSKYHFFHIRFMTLPRLCF